MYLDKKIGIAIPCYNVSRLIAKVISVLPDFVDHIICVDDGSTDDTLKRLQDINKEDGRITILANRKNQGVGRALARGYEWARDNNVDITVRMDGDCQMDPEDLPAIIEPVATGKADYAKGNRFYNPFIFKKMPFLRFFGGVALSFLTKIASGYWHVADSQSGYTAVSLKVLKTVDLNSLYSHYGIPNDLLVTLNIYDFSVIDVPVKPIYGVGEKSSLKIHKVIFSIGFLLIRLFFKRMWFKYIFKSFHPLVLLYFFGFPALFAGVIEGLAILIIDTFYTDIVIGYGWMLLFTILIVSGYFSVVVAMFMDMEYNKDLYRS